MNMAQRWWLIVILVGVATSGMVTGWLRPNLPVAEILGPVWLLLGAWGFLGAILLKLGKAPTGKLWGYSPLAQLLFGLSFLSFGLSKMFDAFIPPNLTPALTILPLLIIITGRVLENSWYRKAADQGDARAQNTLGLMYDKGQGVPQDDVEAVRRYKKAGENSV